MKQSQEKRGYATRVVHRDINTRPSSSRFLIRQTNYDNFVSPNEPRTRCAFRFVSVPYAAKCQTMTGPDEIQLSGETGSLPVARGAEMRGCGFAAYGN